MDDKELESIYHSLNFNDMSFDTFINVYKLYDYSTLVISKDEIDYFNNSFNNYMRKYLSSKT